MAKQGKKFVATKNTEGKKLSGIHIYMDERGRTVYYDVLTKIGYLIEEYEQAYRPFAMRYFLGMFAGILAYMFEAPLWLCAIAGIVVYIFMEIKFRLFLKKVPALLDFKPTKRIGFVQSAANDTSAKVILKLVLYLALAVLFVINAYLEHYTDFMLIASWLLGAFGVFFAGINVMALNYQIKHNTFQLKKAKKK